MLNHSVSEYKFKPKTIGNSEQIRLLKILYDIISCINCIKYLNYYIMLRKDRNLERTNHFIYDCFIYTYLSHVQHVYM